MVLNDALIDWVNGAKNYSALVTQAVAEAPGKHAFLTEYAGSSAVMKDQLAPLGRFGNEQALAASTSPYDFVSELIRRGFDSGTNPNGGPALPSPVIRLLLTEIPYPPAFAAKGISENTFLTSLDYYLGSYRTQNPTDFQNYVLSFDAPILAQQIFAQYVTPMREANALFTHFPTLTRLITTLSPEDMTSDPVFSFNPELPEVSRSHSATLINNCGRPSQLVTEQRWLVDGAATGSLPPEVSATPVALRIESLGEEGPATVLTNNKDRIHQRFALQTDATPSPGPTNGCATIDPMSLGLLTLMALRRRRR